MISGKRWFASPLAGTAGVLLGLGLLAVPLRKLTSAQPVADAKAVVEAHSATMPAVMRLRLLAPARGLSVKTADGAVLLDAGDLEAGESSHDVVIPFDGGHLEVLLEADFGAVAETAVFLTVMPDAFEEQTRFAIGSGAVSEWLEFEWHTH
jgi:hypothetical protein